MNPRRTNWESYKDNLKVNLETLVRRIRTIKDTDLSIDQMQQAVISSYFITALPRPLIHQG
jgi:hypothetical protein